MSTISAFLYVKAGIKAQESSHNDWNLPQKATNKKQRIFTAIRDIFATATVIGLVYIAIQVVR